jgi:predicted phosphodiesterase
MSRYIAIGDVHGCSQELEELLAELKITQEDSIIFLGDLVNRGPDSGGVLKIARSLPNARAVLGNHERRLLKYKTRNDPSVLKESDKATIPQLTPEDWAYMRAMERYIYVPEIETIFVHGGFLPNEPWTKQSSKIVSRIQVIDDQGRARKRSECPTGTPWASLWKGPQFVVFGHTPAFEVMEYPLGICLDTSCAYGGKLTAYILPDKKIVQVPAKRRYWGL